MGFKCGIVGLPNVGKSTIFNALTASGAAAENYPFCTIEPNTGIVEIPDSRLGRLAKVIDPQRVLPAHMEFVDIAGLVRGASKGEGLGNQFLGHIRQTDAIAHVVRCFDDGDITHVDGSVSPVRDIETIESELVISDIDTVAKALQRNKKLVKSGNKEIPTIIAMLEALDKHLQELLPARTFPLNDFSGDVEEVALAFRDLHLISAKKVLFVCNISEDNVQHPEQVSYVQQVKEYALSNDAGIVALSGAIESEISTLDETDRIEFLKDLGLEESGLDQMIRSGFELLGLMTYFTAGEKEVRAWTIPQSCKAPEAAGVIHSDFERGFICAEVYRIEDLEALGAKSKLKENGKLRTEGKGYDVKDGDVMEFRFNV